jgi:hypothetical protein
MNLATIIDDRVERELNAEIGMKQQQAEAREREHVEAFEAMLARLRELCGDDDAPLYNLLRSNITRNGWRGVLRLPGFMTSAVGCYPALCFGSTLIGSYDELVAELMMLRELWLSAASVRLETIESDVSELRGHAEAPLDPEYVIGYRSRISREIERLRGECDQVADVALIERLDAINSDLDRLIAHPLEEFVAYHFPSNWAQARRWAQGEPA